MSNEGESVTVITNSPIPLKLKHSNKPHYLRSGSPPEEFFLKHRGLVVKYALYYTRRYCKEAHLEDFISVGNIALIHAWRKFDETLGWKFSSYLPWWLTRYMGKYLNEIYSTVVLKPSNGDRVIIALRKSDWSLNTLLPDSETEYVDLLPASTKPTDQVMAQNELINLIRNTLHRIAKNDKERTIIEERILSSDPTKLSDLAKRLNLTKQGVSIAEVKIKKRLKAVLLKNRKFKELTQ